MRQFPLGIRSTHATDQTRHRAYFARGDMQMTKLCFDFHKYDSVWYYFFSGAAGATFAFSASAAFSSCSFCIFPPWRTNLRVGENSPRRCPTISSLTRTSIKFFPLCTPKIKPTISGAITDARDQVLITALLPGLNLEIFFNNLGSTNGPFFPERDI